MFLFGNICVCFEENWTNVNGSIYGGPAEVLERPVSQGTSSGNIFLLVLPTPALLVFHEEEEEEEEGGSFLYSCGSVMFLITPSIFVMVTKNICAHHNIFLLKSSQLHSIGFE